MQDMPEPIEVTKEQGLEIFKTRKPLGQFYYWDAADGVYVSLYNISGNAIKTPHEYLRHCLDWLSGWHGTSFLHATRLFAEVEGGYIGYEVTPHKCRAKEVCRFDNWTDCRLWLAQQEFATAIIFNY